MHDVTAQEPKLLVHLKATRNTVPVPRHWCFKRKYLQGKRGIEKPPFELPEFIRRTGIQEMREALQEKVGIYSPGSMLQVVIICHHVIHLVSANRKMPRQWKPKWEKRFDRRWARLTSTTRSSTMLSSNGKSSLSSPSTETCIMRCFSMFLSFGAFYSAVKSTQLNTNVSAKYFAFKYDHFTCRVKNLKLAWRRRSLVICLMSCASLWACRSGRWVSLNPEVSF